jgi:hypothetical protein
LDEDLIAFQSKYLIKHKKWLNDDAAKEKMHNINC